MRATLLAAALVLLGAGFNRVETQAPTASRALQAAAAAQPADAKATIALLERLIAESEKK